MENATTEYNIDALLDLVPGQPLTLVCRTSTANIFLKENVDERQKANVTPDLLRPTTRTESGRFVGIQKLENVACMIIKAPGEAAVIGERNGVTKVVGRETRLKTMHIPLSAIQKVIQH